MVAGIGNRTMTPRGKSASIELLGDYFSQFFFLLWAKWLSKLHKYSYGKRVALQILAVSISHAARMVFLLIEPASKQVLLLGRTSPQFLICCWL